MVSETSTEENCNCPTKDCAQWEPETDLWRIKVLVMMLTKTLLPKKFKPPALILKKDV